MKTKSPIIDPRLKRVDLDSTQSFNRVDDLEEWGTYEVFHQKKRGEQHVHVGVVHAPDSEMALVLAKEQFGRRLHTSSIWVVKTSDVYSLGYENEDMFETSPEKLYREAGGYKLRDKINLFKKEMSVRTSKEKQHAGS
jgi:ring-1,2-phenylacetyl-CoA epoxidase subunit PaaB